MGTIRTLGTCVVVAFAAAACGGGASPVGDVGTTTPVGDWQLRTATPAIDVPDPARVTLSVDESDQGLRAGGTAACNSYGGVLAVDGTAWSLREVAVTEMGCEEPLMAAEASYLDALARIDTWAREDDVLELSGDDVTLTFDLLAPVDPAALTGTTWVLDGLISGTGDSAGVTSVTTGVEPAELRLDEDGTFRLFTGCRDFAGDWTTSGDQIALPSWGQTEDSRGVGAGGEVTCGADAEAQEHAVLGVIEGAFTPEVDGQQLTIRQGDAGLLLRALDGTT